MERVQSGNSFEGTMNLRDGRINHHQIKMLPDGGRLLTYFDITQLKRSDEAANRAKTQPKQPCLREKPYSSNSMRFSKARI